MFYQFVIQMLLLDNFMKPMGLFTGILIIAESRIGLMTMSQYDQINFCTLHVRKFQNSIDSAKNVMLMVIYSEKDPKISQNLRTIF